jgi:hypothetical protein
LLADTDDHSVTNAGSALRSIGAGLLRSRPRKRDRDALVRLVIHPLTAEELVVVLSAKVGAANEHRLFALCPLLEALRELDGELDYLRILELAERHGASDVVAAGLRVAADLARDDRLRFELADRLADTPASAAPRMLEWARYGPSTVRRYSWLRSLYYFALVLLMTPGFRAKLRYVRRSHGLRLSRGRGSLHAALAHWLEPQTARRLAEWEESR